MERTKPLILVVEDDPEIAELLATLFTEHGYRALVARSADQALTILAEVPPAAITLDVSLPGISGLTLLQLLRDNTATHDLPAVLISAIPDVDLEVRHLIQGVVPKPFALDTVLSCVRRVAGPGDAAAHERAIGG